jgi:hypothetical protein
MLNLDRIQTNPRLMRAVTGLTIKQFEALLDSFDRNYEKPLILIELNEVVFVKKRGGKSRLSTLMLKLCFVNGLYCRWHM